VWDQELLDQLYAGALTYVHGHSVGGTNPSLLRAMGAGTAVIGFDSVFNHEVVGGSGTFFATTDEVARCIERAEQDEAATAAVGAALQARAAEVYRWDDIADGYEALAMRLADGATIHGTGRFSRLPIDWNPKPVVHTTPTRITETTGGLA
jgi:glycosyltransferase involved in cell wall biosynthesis